MYLEVNLITVCYVQVMALTLKDRFLFSALSPLNFLLKLTGEFLVQPDSSKWKRLSFILWSYICLVLSFQSNFYMFIKRTQLANILKNQEIGVDKLISVLTNLLIRLTTTTIDTATHANLIFTILPTMKSFLESLEPIDSYFNYPPFSGPVKRFSAIGLIYMLFMV